MSADGSVVAFSTTDSLVAGDDGGKASVRRLQGDGKGAFAVQGRFAAAAVRSGRWLTEDRCGATTVKVQRGTAKVRDLVRKRTKTVRAGRALTVRRR